MTRTSHSSPLFRFAAASLLAATVLTGCSSSNHLAKASGGASVAGASQSRRQLDRSIEVAEKAVRLNPADAAARTALGYAYLQAGRFQSAATSFDDAMKLGDGANRTALSLALAQIGAGRTTDAVAVLDDWRDSIPASDLGLAFALAGETGRGVVILTDALRGGDDSVKLRQNLAYAYALDGNWRDARLMAQQDLPADQIDNRIGEWAVMSRPEDVQKRVAALLDVSIRAEDPGQPQALALQVSPAVEQRAAEADAAAPTLAANAELPAIGEPAAPAVAIVTPAPPPEPVAAPVAPTVASAVQEAGFAAAFAGQGILPPEPVRAKAVAPAPRPAPRVAAAVRPVASGGTHAVQLGSFSSPQGARRAWGIFAARDPQLRNYRMVITPAVVRGKNFWRVAAAGFDENSARTMCSGVKNRGGACFAYAATGAPGRAVPGWTGAGPQKARRR
jgi:Flp pilus assembly protein TadD